MTYKVVVYGTLRRGFNNHYLLKNSKFLGKRTIPAGYRKIVSGLPYLIEDDTGEGCEGELYEVTPLVLSQLDRLEGHPDFYQRKIIPISNKGIQESAWCYIMPVERLGRL